MTNAEALRALATVLEQDETAPYKALRLADPDGLAIALLRQSADELDRMQASLTARDTDLMKSEQIYKTRWLGTHTPVVTPTSEDPTDILPDLRQIDESMMYEQPYRTWCVVQCAIAEIELLRALVPSPAEQAQREEIVPHTPGVMPEGEDVREWTENTSLLSNLCDIALQDAMVDRPGGSYYDDALFVKALAGNGYAIVPLSLVPTQAELAQRKLNDGAWERNKDIREGTDRGME